MSENLSSVKNIVNPFGKFFRNLLLGLIFVIVGFGGSFVGANLLDKPQEVDAAGTYYSYTASIEEVNPFISTNGTYLLNKDIKTYFTTAGSVSDKINSLSDDDYYSSETTYAEKYTNIFLSPNIIIKVPNNYNFLGLVGSTEEPTLKVQDNNKTAIQLKSSNVYSSSLNSTSYENGKIYYTNDTLDYGTSIKYWTALVVRKNSFSAVWKQEIFSSKYVNNIGFTSLDKIVKIQFLKISSAPSGYTKVGALSSGVDVYKSNSTVGDIIFGSSSVIDGIGFLDRDQNKGMFSSLSNLKTIKFDNFNTSLMKSMTYMFASSYSLTSLDLSNFNTSNVTDMSNMFYDCSSLTSLDLSFFNTSNVTDMSTMFYNCISLTNLDVRNFNTSNVTAMDFMFQFCRSLKTLDLSSFNMSSVDNTHNMLNFGIEANIVSLTMPRNYSSALNVTSGHNLYYKGQKVVTAGVASTVGTSYSGKTLTAVSFDTNWRTEILNLSGIGITNVNQIYSIKFSSTVPNSSWKKFGTLSSGVDVYKSNSLAMQSNQIIFYSPETIYLINGYMLFEGLTGLTSISFDNFDTSYNYLVHNMFYNCTSLTRLDLSSFDMSSAYWNAEISDDTTLNMLNFGTNAKIKSLTLPSDFGGNEDGTTTNLEDKYIYITNGIDLYYNGTKVVTAGVECQVTGQYAGKTLTSMAMFEFSWREEIINISNIGFSSINDIVKIQFLKTSDVPSGYTKAGMLKSGIEVYKSSTTVGDIIFCSSDTIYAGDSSSGYGLFQQSAGTASKLKEINFSNFNTSKVTSMYGMFSGCTSLTSLDLSSFNTSNVTNMYGMFSRCTSLTSLDLSSFNTSNVTNMYGMFSRCTSLTSLDLSSFNTSNVTNMYSMFNACNSLTSLDLSNFNMSRVTSYGSMLKLDDTSLGKKSNIQLLKTPKNAPAELAIGCNTTGSRLYNTATNTAVTSVPANSSTSLTYKRGALLTLTAGSGETINAQTGWTISSDKRTATKVIYYDSTIGSMPTATKTGYKFIGWLKSGSTKYATSDAISSDASGSAVFESTQSTLKIDASGGKYNGSISVTQTKNSGETIIIRKSYFTKTGYYFGGFTKSSPFYGSLVDNGTTFTYTFGTTAGITDTLTAKWVDAYTITYAEGDATSSYSYYLGTETKIPGEPKQLKSPHYSSFEKKVSNTENYYINGWATSVGGAKVYDLGGYYTNDANITLYPSWGRYNNITYRDSNNDLLGYDYVVNDFWAKNDEYGLSVDGKFLIGWSRTNGSSTAEYLIDNNYNYVSGLTLYPVFENGYTITYNINGYSTEGSNLDGEVVRVGKGVTLKNSDAILIAPQLYLNSNDELVVDIKNDGDYTTAYRIADYYFIGWTTIAPPEYILNFENLSSFDPYYAYTNSEINIEAPNSERFNKVEYYPGEYIVPTGNIELYPVFRNIAIGYLDKDLDYTSGLDSVNTSSVTHISFVRTSAWGNLPSTVYYNDANGNKVQQSTDGATLLGTIALTGTGANVIPWPDSSGETHYERIDSNDWFDSPNYDSSSEIRPSCDYGDYRNYTLRAYLIGDNHLVYAFDGDLYGYSITGEFNFGFLRDTFSNLESFYFENIYFGTPYEAINTIGTYERGLLNTWINSYDMPSLSKADLLQSSNNNAVDGSGLFQGYTGLKSVYFPEVSEKTISWDLSSFSNTGSMFSGCTNLLNIDGSNKVLFNLSGSGSTDNMFSGCSSLTSIDLSTVDSTKLVDMSYMFNGCTNLIEVKLTDFDTSKIQFMSNLFRNCSKLTSLDLRSFIIFSGCDVTDIFSGCSSLAKIVTPKSLGKTLQLPSNYKYYNVNDKVKVGNSFNTATTKTLKPYYDIIFNVDGGSSLETLTYLYDIDSTGSQTVNLPSATKTNLTFTGYSITTNSSPASGLSNLVLTVPKNAKGDITLKANYGSKITFYATSDTAYSTNTYTIDANYSLPTTPTKSGYTFLGWTRDKNGTEPEWTSGQQKADENTSWYAVWRKSDGTHTETGETLTHIFYKTSDSDFDSVTTTTTLNYINDVMNYNYNISKSKKISNGTVSSTTYGPLAYRTLSTTNGYTFVGWNSSSDVSSSAEWTSGAKNPTTNTSWYALWKKTENFNKDGGVLTHTFYNTSDSDKTTVTTKITQSITNGTVYYNYNKSKTIQTGGTVSSTTYQQLDFETPTRTNYTFLGWTSTKTDTTASWTEGSKQVSADTSWYAVWQRANGTHTETATLTHTFYKTSDTNKETAITTRTDSYSGDLMAYNYNLSQSRRISNGTVSSTTYGPLAYRTLSTTNGYTFVGWTETKSATSASWIEGAQKFSTNTSWYAVWRKTKNYSKTSTLSHIFVFGSGESDYKIVESTLTTNYTNGTFNYPYTQTGDGELVTNGTEGTKTGSAVAYQTATKTGYTLGGWNTDGSYTATWGSGTTKSPTSDTTYYAVWTKTSTHTFNYNANGHGTAPASTSGSQTQSYSYDLTKVDNQTLSIIVKTRPAISVTGYTQSSWNTKSDGTGTSYALNTDYPMPSGGSTTLYAIWSLNNVNYNVQITMNATTKPNVTVTANGTSKTASSGTTLTFSIPYGTTFTPSATITSNGKKYNLVWGTNTVTNTNVTTVSGSQVTLTSAITQKITVTQLYTITAYKFGSTVTNLPSGWTNGTTTITKVLLHDETLGTLPTVAKEGYTFNGWTDVEPSASAQSLAPSGELMLGPVLRATPEAWEIVMVWMNKNAPNYAQIWDEHLGSVDLTTADAKSIVKYLDEYKATIDKGSSTVSNANNRLAEKLASISSFGYFKDASGIVKAGLVPSGSTSMFDEPKADLTTTKNEDKNIYADFSGITYTITYNTDGGNTISSTSYTTSNSAQTKTLTTPTKSGYMFGGYTITTNTSGIDSTITNKTTLNIPSNAYGNIVVKATWTLNTYTVTAKYGTGISSIGYSISENGTYTTIANNGSATLNAGTTYYFKATASTGYTFSGWSDWFTSTSNPASKSETTSTARTLQANATVNTYKIDFNGNGSTNGAMSTITATYGQAKTLPRGAFLKPGYTFTGWATSATGAKVYNDKDPVTNLTSTNNATVTLYAVWSKDTYTITYNLDGGVNGSGATTSYNIDSTAITLPTPTKTGYTFKGWTEVINSGTMNNGFLNINTGYVEDDGTYTNSKYSQLISLQSGKTYELRASVSTDWRTRIFTSAGVYSAYLSNNITRTPSSNEFISLMNHNNHSGIFYVSTRGTISSIPKGSTGNREYTATWEIESYTIKFNSNGGTSCSDITATYGASITLPSPTKANNTFAGWYSDSGLTNKVTWTTMPDLGNNGASTTLYAKWTSKADNGVVVSAKTLTYTGSAQELVTVTNPHSVTIYYSLTSLADAQSTTIPKGTNAGNYTVYWYAVETATYKSSNGNVLVTINKAGNTPTVNMSGYVYGGTKSTPTLSNNKSTGSIIYFYSTTNSNSNGTNWAEVLTSTQLNAGTYYMYATISGDTNYNAYTTSTVSFTISKAKVTISAKGNYATTASTKFYVEKTFDNSTTATVKKDTHYTVTSTGNVPTPQVVAKYSNSNVGTWEITITATLTDTTNFEFTSGGNTCKVNGKINAKNLTGTITIKDIPKPTYGNTLETTNTISGSFSYMWYWSADGTTSWTKCSANNTDSTFMITSSRVGTDVVVGKYLMVVATGTGNYAGSIESVKSGEVVKLDSDIVLTHDTITKVYDGTTSVKQTITAKLKGLDVVTGDVGGAVLTVKSSVYNNATVGTGKTVTVTVEGSGAKIGNYSFSSTKTTTGAITKATGTINAISDVTIDYPKETTKTVTITSTGDGALSVSSSATGVATASLSGKTITITAKSIGSSTITVTLGDGTNYAGASKTFKVTVKGSTYTVTLNTNGGTIASGNVTSYTYGTGATLPTNVTKTGHTFAGWFNNSSLTGTKVTSISSTDTGNKEYWAKWTVNTYRIIYYIHDGITFVEQTGLLPEAYTYGEEVKLAQPENYGYKLDGWYLSSDEGQTNPLTETPPNAVGTLELYAFWEPVKVTITLNGDGATSTNHTTSVTATYGEAMPQISVLPTRTGYSFDGYYTEKNGAGTQYYTSSGASARNWNSEDSKILYAKWTVNNIDYTVQITMNATTKPNVTVTANGTSNTSYNGEKLTFSIPYGTTFTPTATIESNGKKYNLVWGTNTVTNTNVTTVSGSQVTLTSDTTQKITVTQLYTITAYKLGGTVSGTLSGWTETTDTLVKVLKYNETLGTLPTLTKTGYTFNGWTDVEPSASAQSLAPSGELMLGPVLRTAEANVIIMNWINKNAPNYSQIWENHLSSIDMTMEDADKAVSYLADYKTTIDKGSSTVSSANNKLADSLALLGTFGFKNADEIVNAGLVPSGSTSMFDKDLTTTKNEDKNIYADFTINSSTLTVNPNEGIWSGSTSTQNFTQNYNTTKTIVDPTRTGYTFAGWTLSSGANGTFSNGVYTFGPQNGVTDTLTANWTSKADNGVVVSAKTLTYTGSAQELVTVTNPHSVTIYYSLTSLADAQSTKSTTIPKRTDAGSYTVYWYAVETATYKSSSGSVQVTINRAKTATVTASDKTYNGSEQTGVTGSNVTLTGTIKATNAGEYTAKATPTANYAWSDGTYAEKTVTWKIERLGISVPSSPSDKTYNTQSQNSGITAPTGSSIVTASSTTSATNAGEYNVVLAVDANHKWADGSTTNKTVTWRIKRYDLSNATITLEYTTKVYTGSALTPSVTVNVPIPSSSNPTTLTKDTHYTVGYSDNTNVGTATVTITAKDGTNYTGSKTTNFSITQAENNFGLSSASVTIKVNAQLDLSTYIQNAKGTVTYTVKSSTETTKGTLSGSKYTAGSLSTANDNDGTVVITITDAGNTNYPSVSKEFTITVEKYTRTLAFDSNIPSSIVYGTTGKVAKATMSGTGGTAGSITYSSSAVGVLTVNATSGALTTVSVGQSTITANLSRTATVKSASITKTISVTRLGNLEVPTQKGTLTYNGNSQSPQWNNYDTSKLTIGGTTSGTNANTYTATFTPTANYAWSDGSTTAKNVTWTINKASLTITAENKTTIYGDTLPSYTYTISGFVNSETESVLSTKPTTSCSYQRYGNVGSYDITVSGAVASNYNITYKKGTLTVSQREVTISWPTTTTFTYDGNEKTFKATIGNLVNSDSVDFTYTNSSPKVTVATASGNYTAEITGLSGTKKDNYKLPSTNLTKSWSIGTAVISFTASDVTKVYDGNSYGITVTVTNPTSGYTIKYGTTSGTYNLTESPKITNVADSKTIYFQITAPNYTTTTGSATVTITPKSITTPTVSGTATYGNTLTASDVAGASYQWQRSTDGSTWINISSATSKTLVLSATSVGVATVKGLYIRVVTTGSGNYTGTTQSTATSQVSAKALSWSTLPTVSNKTYDGNTTATISNHGAISGVLSGDTCSLDSTNAKATFENATAGNSKAVTITGYALTGTHKDNYTLSQPSGVKANISKKQGTINAISDVTIDYPKETTKTVTITSSGDGALSVSSSATGVATASLSGKTITLTAKSIGSSTITVTLGDGTNYLGTTIQFTVTVNASTYTVTISVNDANLGSVSKTKVENVPYETAITISGNKLTILDQTITASVIDKTGYTTTFTGFDKTTGTKVTGNMTITANFTRTANKYIVTFNADGGEISETTKEVTFGEAYGQLPVPTKSGYNFDGWYKESGFTTKVDDTTIVSDAKNHTLYAKWTINMEQVVARINNNYYFSLKEAIESVNSGTVIIYLLKSNTENWSEAIKINSGVAINLVSQKSSEVQFEIGTGRIELNGGTLTLGKNSSTTYETVEGDLNDFALVGSGTVIKVVSGTLNVFGGKLQSSTTDVELAGGTMNINLGPSFTKGILLSDAGTLNIHKDFVSTVPVRLNDDMYTAGNVVVNFDSYESAMTINGRVDIKLKDNTFTLFVENNQMKLAGKILVTYNGNGGKMLDDSETFVQTIYYPEGARTISNPFVRSGYTFAGFDTNKDASEGSIKIGDTINFSADTTLYAIWEKDKTEITITYKVAVISSSKDTNVSYQEFGTEVVDIRKEVTLKTYTQLTSTDYSKYIFFGWFENEPEGILTDNQGLTSIKTSTKDITLYGKLIKKNIRNIEGYNDSQFTLSVAVEGLDANQIYGIIKITYFDEQLGQNRTFTTALKGGETHITGLKYARYTLEFETTFKVEEMNDVVVDTRQEKNSTVNLVISKNNKSGYYYIGSI